MLAGEWKKETRIQNATETSMVSVSFFLWNLLRWFQRLPEAWNCTPGANKELQEVLFSSSVKTGRRGPFGSKRMGGIPFWFSFILCVFFFCSFLPQIMQSCSNCSQADAELQSQDGIASGIYPCCCFPSVISPFGPR